MMGALVAFNPPGGRFAIAGVGLISAACVALGLSRATLHRHRIRSANPVVEPQPRPSPP